MIHIKKIIIIFISVLISMFVVLVSLNFLIDTTFINYAINTNSISMPNNDENVIDAPIVDNELLNNEILLENKENELVLNKSKIILDLQNEKEKILEAIIKPENGSVTWMSFDENIAKVDETGKVIAISEGETSIVAICGELSSACIVEVKAIKDDETDINVELDDIIEEENSNTTENIIQENSNTNENITQKNNNKGNSLLIEENFIDVKNKNINLNLTNKKEENIDFSTNINGKVYFMSTNKNVATVDKNGKVLAVGVGNAKIIVSCSNKAVTCNVNVIDSNKTQNNVSENNVVKNNVLENNTTQNNTTQNNTTVVTNTVSLNRTTLDLACNDNNTYILKAAVTPSNASVTWSSSNTSVATVNQSGKVTALKNGTAEIKAQTGDSVATCKITVITKATKISLSTNNLTMDVNTTKTLTATIQPSGAQNNKVTWSSSNTSVATVNQSGKVTALKNGTAEIKAQTGNLVATCKITVITKATKISLSTNNLTMDVNTTKNLTATIQPSGAKNNKVTWTTSNSKVANVTTDGKITAVGGGEATITAKVDNVSTSCTIKVRSFTDSDMNQIKTIVSNSGVPKVQVAIIDVGEVTKTYAYNCSDNERFYVSTLSKTVLGIIAAKMEQDGIVDLDQVIDKYWYALKNYNFNTCTSEWKSYIGSESDVKKHAGENILQNPATLRNCLTHSSTIMNGNMWYFRPGDTSTECFYGSMSATYTRALFMLGHTYGQLFTTGAIPGKTTSYNYLKDELTREHALAGFTMQVAMKQSVNEYLQSQILTPLGISGPSFKKGNSIYFATSYQTSAKDLAKIIALVANDGIYNGKRILNQSTINEIEKVEKNLNNQTIAFSYVNGKYIRHGSISSFNFAYEYDLNDIKDYYSYASYDPNTKKRSSNNDIWE